MITTFENFKEGSTEYDNYMKNVIDFVSAKKQEYPILSDEQKRIMVCLQQKGGNYIKLVNKSYYLSTDIYEKNKLSEKDVNFLIKNHLIIRDSENYLSHHHKESRYVDRFYITVKGIDMDL